MAERRRIRVLICNRYTLFREGLKALLPPTAPIEVVGEARTTRQTLRLLVRLHPDVVLLDATTDDASGAEAIRLIKTVDPAVQVLIVSLNDDAPLISDCMRAGAAGHLGIHARSRQLSQAIHSLVTGGELPAAGGAGLGAAI